MRAYLSSFECLLSSPPLQAQRLPVVLLGLRGVEVLFVYVVASVVGASSEDDADRAGARDMMASRCVRVRFFARRGSLPAVIESRDSVNLVTLDDRGQLTAVLPDAERWGLGLSVANENIRRFVCRFTDTESRLRHPCRHRFPCWVGRDLKKGRLFRW